MAALSGAFIISLTMCTATASGASGASKSPIVVGGVAQLADYSGIADGFNARIAQFISEGAQFVKGGPKAPLAVSGARMTAESRSTGALKQPSWLPVIGEGGQGRP